MGLLGGRRGDRGQPESGQAERGRDAAVRALFADPFGGIERSLERVSTIRTADDTAAVMIDDKPAFGLGLIMRREEDRWRIILPLNLPGLARYVPRSREEWMIVASMIQVVDNAVVELAADVRAGKCGDVEQVSQRAGEKAFMPLMMCFIAYNRAMEAREAAPK